LERTDRAESSHSGCRKPFNTSQQGVQMAKPRYRTQSRFKLAAWPSRIPVIYKVAVRHGSAMSQRPEAMVPKGRTGVTQALPSVESAAIGLSTWDVR
jgi:hypothetical protein